MQANNWMPYPKYKPVKNCDYLVTRQITPTRKVVDIKGWTDNLHKMAPDEFYRNKQHPGWYEYDCEWGFYEVTDVIGWRIMPDPM